MPPTAQDKKKTLPELEDELLEDADERGFLPELVRRGLTLGFTGLFLTEEAMRKVVGDKVPREWLEFIMEQSDRTRTELVDRLSREFGRVLSALDPVEVMRRLLDGHTVEVTARIRFASEEDRKDGAGASVSAEAHAERAPTDARETAAPDAPTDPAPETADGE